MSGTRVNTIYPSDKKMLMLKEILKAKGVIKFDTQFCEAMGLLKQNLINIKKGNNHFTAEHIQKAVTAFGVNANWIFGTSDHIFVGNKKRHIEKKDTQISNNTV